jgi:glycosyltransferase involved in cell wall biosynthesis
MVSANDCGNIRLAIIVSHPIQYYVPLYRRLVTRTDLKAKVFFTWHAAEKAQHDPGFSREVAWDIPLTEGYEYELVENTASNPGSDHFWGIRNRTLIRRVLEWRPDAVHITGYAYASHLQAMRAFHRRGVPVLFRGDSHLLDQRRDWRWRVKKALLQRVYDWTSACLYVGRNNLEYYREFGVPPERLFYCPHSIEVCRFADPTGELVRQAEERRRSLQIPAKAKVLLFAAKFEARKQPLQLMQAIISATRDDLVLIMLGDGPLDGAIRRLASEHPTRFRVLPFQNQSVMPVAYRLSDIFVLPSAYGETWGLAANEAIASGRRVLLSDMVGGAADLVRSPDVGAIFASQNWVDFHEKLNSLLAHETRPAELMRISANYDVPETERRLVAIAMDITSCKTPNPS